MNIIFCFALKENMLFLKAVDYYLYFLERQTGNLTNCPGLGEGALYHKTIIHGEIHHLSAAARIYSSSNLLWFNSSWDTQLLRLHPSDLYLQRVNLIPVYPQQESVCVHHLCVYVPECIQWTLNCVTTCVFSFCHTATRPSDLVFAGADNPASMDCCFQTHTTTLEFHREGDIALCSTRPKQNIGFYQRRHVCVCARVTLRALPLQSWDQRDHESFSTTRHERFGHVM